jgi:hypothetical protein
MIRAGYGKASADLLKSAGWKKASTDDKLAI